jgi:hypothetical protein
VTCQRQTGWTGARGDFCAALAAAVGPGRSHPHVARPGEACNGTAPRLVFQQEHHHHQLLLLLLLFKKGRPRRRDSVERRSYRSTILHVPFARPLELDGDLLPVVCGLNCIMNVLHAMECVHTSTPVPLRHPL